MQAIRGHSTPLRERNAGQLHVRTMYSTSAQFSSDFHLARKNQHSHPRDSSNRPFEGAAGQDMEDQDMNLLHLVNRIETLAEPSTTLISSIWQDTG